MGARTVLLPLICGKLDNVSLIHTIPYRYYPHHPKINPRLDQILLFHHHPLSRDWADWVPEHLVYFWNRFLRSFGLSRPPGSETVSHAIMVHPDRPPDKIGWDGWSRVCYGLGNQLFAVNALGNLGGGGV